LGLYISFWKI